MGVGRREPSFLACGWFMAGFSPRPHKVFKEVGGVLFSQMLVQSAVHLIEGDFVILLHRTLIIYNFEVEIFHLLPKTDRDCIGFASALTRHTLVKTCIVLSHDPFLQFGRCFDVRCERLVEVGETLFDLGSHCDSILHVGYLGLEDGDALVNDRTTFVQRTLFACGVLG